MRVRRRSSTVSEVSAGCTPLLVGVVGNKLSCCCCCCCCCCSEVKQAAEWSANAALNFLRMTSTSLTVGGAGNDDDDDDDNDDEVAALAASTAWH